MRSRMLRLVTLTASFASLAAISAPDAHAAARGPGGGGSTPIRTPVCFNPPSLAQCADASYVTTCKQRDLCLRVQADDAATKRTTSPDATSNGALQASYVDPYKLNVSVAVPSLSFQGEALPYWLAAQKAGEKLAQATQPMHPAYIANGQAVASCEEYAYQKYYDLNRYEDAVKALGTDWWSIVDLTFMPSSQGPGISDRTLYEYGYTPPRPSYAQLYDPKLVDTGNHTKNAFFANSLDVFQELQNAGYSHGLPAAIAALLKNPAAYAYKGGNYPSSYFDFAQARAAEHRPGGIGSTPLYSDAAYRAMAIRRAQYSQIAQKIWQGSLLMLEADNQWQMDTAAAAGSAGGCPGVKVGKTCAIVDPSTGVPYVKPNTIDEYWPPAVPLETAASPDVSWLSTFENDPAHAMANTIYQTTYAKNAPATDGGCGFEVWYDCNHDYLYAQGLATKAKYEWLLARFLETEYALPGHGCFNTASSACDWTPRDVARTYGSAMSEIREMAYARCIQGTGNNFKAVAYADIPDTKGLKRQDYWFPPQDDALGIPNYKGNYTYSTDQVDVFAGLFTKRSALWKQYQDAESLIVKQVDDIPIDDTVKGIVVHSSDHHQIFDSGAFGAGYSYDMGWQVTPATTQPFGTSEQRICRLAGTMHGSIAGTVSGFGMSYNVFNAGFDAAGTPTDAHSTAFFTVAGTDVFQGTNPTLSGSPSAPFSVSAPVVQHDLPAVTLADQWFLLLDVVPVHLQAFIASSAGVDLSLGVNNPEQGCNFENVTYSLHSTLKPWARADLVGQAAVDVGFADAGVRATLNLLTVGVPFTMGIDAAPIAGHGTGVTFSNNMSVSLAELGGDVELFADINALVASYHAKKVVFSWEGFHQEKTLWSQSKNFSLDALSIRLLTPGMQPPAPPPASGGI